MASQFQRAKAASARQHEAAASSHDAKQDVPKRAEKKPRRKG